MKPPVVRTEHAGFTVIELLVVIAVLALLVAILVPVLRGPDGSRGSGA